MSHCTQCGQMPCYDHERKSGTLREADALMAKSLRDALAKLAHAEKVIAQARRVDRRHCGATQVLADVVAVYDEKWKRAREVIRQALAWRPGKSP